MNTILLDKMIRFALEEDIGPSDITTELLVEEKQMGEGVIIAKAPLVIAGIPIAGRVFEILETDIQWESHFREGEKVEKGQTVFSIKGTLQALLKGERTALNFLQRLSGIATHVRSFMDIIEKYPVRLVDTRKTAPGWRMLEKYAVRLGGAFNHRFGLYDGVLIKDNHIAVCGGVKQAIERIRKQASHLLKIEVEVSNMDELAEALDAIADVIMLDNMSLADIRKCVSLINGRALVEVSGNVNKENLAEIAATGVDIISSGALTHSAPSVDLSMKIFHGD